MLSFVAHHSQLTVFSLLIRRNKTFENVTLAYEKIQPAF